MIYMSPLGVKTTQELSGGSGLWGKIFSPRSFQSPVGDMVWCVDNDAFNTGFNPPVFFSFLKRMKKHQSSCVFVAVPDVVGNAVATMDMFRWFAWKVKVLGYPVAFVCQDGQESYPLPPEFDALFIGGTTEWKLSPAADKLIYKAKQAGKWVHVGRVNTQKRIRHFQLVGVDSVDGTSLSFGPEKNFPVINTAIQQKPLFKIERE